MAVWKLAPALAMGNTWCSSRRRTRRSRALRLAELLDEADLPKGVVNVITGRRRVGRRGAGLAPRRRQGLVHRLDRGRSADHAACVGHDQEGARSSWAASRPTSSTRTPTWTPPSTARCGRPSSTRARSASRAPALLVPESIHDEFVELLVARARARSRSATRSTTTPTWVRWCRRSSSRPVERYVRIGREEGAKPVLGGGRPTPTASTAAHFFQPDDLRRRRQLDDDRPGGDLRPGAVGHPVRDRRRGGGDRQRLDLRAGGGVWSAGLDRGLETATQACAPARCGSTTTT